MQPNDITSKQLELIRELEETGAFRVLRSISTPGPQPGTLRRGERLAIVVDTETTGLDLRDDEIVEIGLVAFAYDEDDQFTRVVATFEGLREPENPMSEDATNITGITAEMLKGKKIDFDRLEKIVGRASLVIAHNAAFDRPMCEKLSAAFKDKAWACSATEVPWKSLGYEGAKLGYLLYQSGLFHQGHRALEDCYALLNVLSVQQKEANKCGLQLLLASARETRVIIEVSSPFELRDFFRGRGYRWKSHPARRWYKDVLEADLEIELREIGQLNARGVRATTHSQTAFDRFKAGS
ncbi:DNA polymerase III subunit epsilon protein [Rhizobium sp. N541]|uniref:3'-5' exonuclease n=1 Tax=unclassified Rhizobium TaxID=2613769 RepID=UPI0007F069F0|nr:MULTISPECIES: 3'-5' exonuclease [unclassified Rhizobium]ANM16332.1 DNA polymerase III subunit epsilon protein [Rhizobium sp. N541]ANM22717.1 DNA polymerase III subunit epsilon protein [Rhizobium sp. N941]